MANGSEGGETRGGARFGAGKAAIIIALVVVAGAAIYMKQHKQSPETKAPKGAAVSSRSATPQTKGASGANGREETKKADIPRMVDLGAGKCIPCKMMMPILEELKAEYEGKLEVDFVDVWENPEAGRAYGIRLIPTQIFYAPSGKELYRHEGFMSKEDILAQWKSLGFDFRQ